MLGWSTQLGNKLFGPDPKLEFRKPGQGLDLLAGPTIPLDAPYWNQYLHLFDTPTDVPLLLPSPSLLHALHSSPLNVLTLVHFCASALFRLLATPSFPRGESHPRQALNAVRVLARVVPLLLAPRGLDAHGREVTDQVEDELFWRRERVPVAPAAAAQSERPPPTGESAQGERGAARDDEGQFVLEDDDEDADGDAGAPDPLSAFAAVSSSTAEAEPAYEELPPLAERLLGALVDLLFVPGFTVAEALRPRDETGEGEGSVVTYAIWEPGIASSAPSPPLPLSHFLARLEVLRLLTLLLSLPSLLTPPGLFLSIPNRWREALVSGAAAGRGDRNVVLCLLCSTLNTALAGGASSPAAETSAEGDSLRARAARLAADAAKRAASGGAPALGGTAGGAPLDEAGARSALAGASLHLLSCVLLEHAPAPSPAAKEEAAAPNLFAHYLAKVHRPADLAFLLAGVLHLLEGALAAPPPQGGLFASAAGVGAGGEPRRDPLHATEAVVLLLRLLALNRKFALFAARSAPQQRVRLVVALEACVLQWRADDAALGLVRAASGALQAFTAEVAGAALSAGEEACEQLCREMSAPLGAENVGPRLSAVVRRLVEAQGVEWERREGEKGEPGVSCAEFLMISLHAVLLPSTSAQSAPASPSRTALQALYPSRLLALANLSPFVRGLGHDAATRLVRVWLAFSAPSWVMMEEGNPRLMYYLLETFNNIIHFNLDSNPHLLYSLSITLKRFALLAHFTLAQGIVEARRLRAARRDRQTQAGRLAAVSEDAAQPLASVAAGPAPAAQEEEEEGEEGGSERARGKRPERERERERSRALSISSVADLSLSSPSLGAGASGSRTSLALEDAGDERPFVGRGGLPLDTLLILLSTLQPLLASHDPSFPSSSSPPSPQTIAHVRTLLRSPSITSLLPPPAARPPPKTRPLAPSPAHTAWLASLSYGRVYLALLPYLRDTLPVQLFAVASAPSSSSAGGWRAGGGLVQGLSAGLGAEMERVGRSAVEVGGRVGGAVRGVLGRFGGAQGARG
ncbi:hypothetical protein JCM10450v2_000959 [Rhodotorula kratochvilovae]